MSKLKWSDRVEDEDIEAARRYLTLLIPDRRAAALVHSLRAAETVRHAAKDLLRASRLPLLPREDAHVDKDLKRIEKEKTLAPVLLIRGQAANGIPLLVGSAPDRVIASRAAAVTGIFFRRFGALPLAISLGQSVWPEKAEDWPLRQDAP
jgi:hypothetical protein